MPSGEKERTETAVQRTAGLYVVGVPIGTQERARKP